MIGNIGAAVNFTPSDDPADNIAGRKYFNMFAVGTAGDVVIVPAKGDPFTIAAFAGLWIPCGNAVRINSTDTTASQILVV